MRTMDPQQPSDALNATHLFNVESLADSKVIFYVRHGQSEGQLDPSAYAIIGDGALKLTPLGHEQSFATGRLLDVFAHKARLQLPLTLHFGTSVRTHETAQDILATSSFIQYAETSPDERLEKQKFGVFDGMLSSKERAAKQPLAFAQYRHDLKKLGEFRARPEGGESIEDVFTRMKEFNAEILRDPRPSIVVTHGLPELCGEADLLGHDENWIMERADTVPNASIRMIYGTSEKGFHAVTLVERPTEVLDPDHYIDRFSTLSR